MTVIEGGICTVSIEVKCIERSSHIPALVARIAEKTSVVIPIVTPCIGHRGHDSHRASLFQLRLKRIIVRVCTSFKCTHIVKETFRTGATEFAIRGTYTPEPVASSRLTSPNVFP